MSDVHERFGFDPDTLSKTWAIASNPVSPGLPGDLWVYLGKNATVPPEAQERPNYRGSSKTPEEPPHLYLFFGPLEDAA